MEWYVGLDVHSKRSVYVIEADAGRVVARGDIPTTPAGFRQLRRQHELPAETPVALETGTVAFYAARELARVGLRPVVIDAHEVRVKAHRPSIDTSKPAIRRRVKTGQRGRGRRDRVLTYRVVFSEGKPSQPVSEKAACDRP
ncbi:MAG TPA: hypothetical protein VJ829_01545 [Candidatus Binatia bacterium]|nr:hypothetical protein [Candidatus Binatia bacterium]